MPLPSERGRRHELGGDDRRRPSRRRLRRGLVSLAAAAGLVATPSAAGTAAAAALHGYPSTVAIASTHTGYLEVTDAGNVFNHHTPFYGSMAGRHLPAPIVDVAVDPNTDGYWLVTSAGNVYNFHAPWYGSAVGRHPGAPIVGITATRTGYLLTTTKGNVYQFHTAFYGSKAHTSLPAPVVDITADPNTDGYWLTTAEGNVYNFHAPWYGSPRGRVPTSAAVNGIVGTPTGYLVTTTAGNVFQYHTAFHGSKAHTSLPAPVVDITADPNIHGAYWVATESGTVYAFAAPGYGQSHTVGAAACTAAQLRASEHVLPGAAGHSGDILRFTNTSGQLCTLTGYPGVGGLGPHGHQVTQARRSKYGFYGGVHGNIPTVALAPAETASAITEGTDNPVSAHPCPTLAALLVTPPGTRHATRLPHAPGDCSGLQVHPVVRGSSGGKASSPSAPVRHRLLGAISSYLRSRRGTASVAVHNQVTGYTTAYDPRAQDTASIVKVDILATLLHQDEISGRSLSATQRRQAKAMIEYSNDRDATALWNDIGKGPGLNSFDRLAGLDHTTPGSDDHWGLTRTPPADQITLLRVLEYPNSLLDRSDRAYELNLMAHVTSRQSWGISAGPAGHANIELKNGWLPLRRGDWQVNSIGMVTGSGRSYQIAVMTTGSPTESYGIGTIEGVSRVVWKQINRAGS